MMTKAYRPHGTLLLAVIYRDGVILAGDKGGHGGVIRDDEVDLTEQVKIVCVNEKIVMAATGHATIANPDNHSEQWVNCLTAGTNHFRENPFTNTDELWNGLTQAIAQTYKKYIEWSNDTDPLSLELPIIYYADGRLWLRVLDLQYDGSQVMNSITPQHWFEGFFTSWGYSHVPFGLLSKESRFRALARHASVRPFLDMSTSPQTVSLERAINFVRKIMEISSKVEPSKGNVSPKFNHVTIKGRVMFAPITEE